MKTLRKQSPEINMIPYIDILLVLLLIFMLCGSQHIASMSLTLPELKSGHSVTEKVKTLYLNQSKEVYVNKTFLSHLMHLDINRLKKVLAVHDKVLVQADKDIVYSDMMHLLKSIREAGLENVELAYTPT